MLFTSDIGVKGSRTLLIRVLGLGGWVQETFLHVHLLDARASFPSLLKMWILCDAGT